MSKCHLDSYAGDSEEGREWVALRHTAECDLGVKIIMGTAVNSGASLWCLGEGVGTQTCFATQFMQG